MSESWHRARHAERAQLARENRPCLCARLPGSEQVPLQVGTACPTCGGIVGTLRELRELNQERIRRERDEREAKVRAAHPPRKDRPE